MRESHKVLACAKKNKMGGRAPRCVWRQRASDRDHAAWDTVMDRPHRHLTGHSASQARRPLRRLAPGRSRWAGTPEAALVRSSGDFPN